MKLFIVGEPDSVEDGEMVLDAYADLFIAESKEDVYEKLRKERADFATKYPPRQGQSYAPMPPIEEMGIREIDMNEALKIGFVCNEDHL